MPVWWDKLSGRGKESDLNIEYSSLKNQKKPEKESGTSEDFFILPPPRNSPRNSKDFSPNRRNSGFDLSSSFDRAQPLPRPLDCPSQLPDNVHGGGSGSVSSVSSSGSPDDALNPVEQSSFRDHTENRLLSPLSRSPGRGTTRTPTANSPKNARINGMKVEFSSGKLEDGSHKLPLPPGSPISLSSIITPRSPRIAESSNTSRTKWRKGKFLGRGTFGHVYLGFNSENGQMCAMKEVKVVSDDRSAKECLKQLNQEIALLSKLSHPNIVQYYGSDLNEERLSVYLEYVSGGSIHKLLQEYGSFREPVIQNYTRQILSGLAYLHGRNTVHRDIKGANILVDPNGEIKVADFGMAKHITSCSSMLSFKGSPYWMAPEVVMNTNGYSLPVDIWSLGCTVLEMATTKPPWSHIEGVAAIFKIGNSKDTPDIPEHLSVDARSFIRLCLQREPSARPTASQLLNHPFIRNQTAAVRENNANVNTEAFDGSRGTSLSPRHFRDNSQTMASLPLSPSSSPLRRDASAYRNFFHSPAHPSNAFPIRPNSKSSLDSWLEMAQFRVQAPVMSSKGLCYRS